MVYLFMLACSIADPEICHKVKLVFESEKALTPQQCMQNGQFEMAKWAVDHPGYRIQKWKCTEKNEEDL